MVKQVNQKNDRTGNFFSFTKNEFKHCLKYLMSSDMNWNSDELGQVLTPSSLI